MGYPCPCCWYLTLGEEPPGTFEICPVCNWEDDYAQYHHPAMAGGANKESLNQARSNFLEIGAISTEALARVREPLAGEIPPDITE
jgi:hypothetical protein